MNNRVSKKELESRISRLIKELNDQVKSWDTAIIIDKINQYYFTGTMQDGMLIIRRSGQLAYFVRRSIERAKLECPLDCILPMDTYRQAANIIGAECGITLIETERVTLDILNRIKKHFDMQEILPIDKLVFEVRSIKSSYELQLMEQAGRLHNDVLVNVVPALLKEGMSELELSSRLYSKMLEMGHHGVTRFYMFQTEVFPGQVTFGDNSLFPTYYDSPGGMVGMSPAAPVLGSRQRTLKKGDLVFIDVGFGLEGYNTDKTQVYCYGAQPPEEAVIIHKKCLEIEQKAASLLKPGSSPSEIYNSIVSELDSDFMTNFMGYGNKTVNFLGHGIGLHVDEFPVIANGFFKQLKENMVMAIEPKKGISGIGMVGSENTYVVTNDGGRCITGGGSEIIQV